MKLLLGNLAKHKKHTPATVTSAMNAAATQDLRAITVWPGIYAKLASTPAPSPRADQL